MKTLQVKLLQKVMFYVTYNRVTATLPTTVYMYIQYMKETYNQEKGVSTFLFSR
jgi:hypothetical protein